MVQWGSYLPFFKLKEAEYKAAAFAHSQQVEQYAEAQAAREDVERLRKEDTSLGLPRRRLPKLPEEPACALEPPVKLSFEDIVPLSILNWDEFILTNGKKASTKQNKSRATTVLTPKKSVPRSVNVMHEKGNNFIGAGMIINACW